MGALFYLISALCAHAGAEVLSLEQVVQDGLNRPGYSDALSAQDRLRSLSQRDRLRRFVPNEPTLNWSRTDDGSPGAYTSYGAGLTLSLPFKTFAAIHLDSARARQQEVELAAKHHEAIRGLAQGYIDCSSARELAAIQKMTMDDLDTLAHSLKALYESGNSTQAEKIGGELQVRQTRNDWVTASDHAEVACRKLADTLGAEVPSLALPDDLPPAILDQLPARTADLARAESVEDVAAATSSNAFWNQLPDLALTAGRNRYDAGFWTTSYGVGITIPIFFPVYEGAETSRTRAQASLDRAGAELQKIAARADERDAAREYRRSRARLLELRKTDLALAEAWVDSTYSAYKTGKLGFAELITSRKTLSDLKSQDVQLRASIITSHLRCLNHCSEQEPSK